MVGSRHAKRTQLGILPWLYVLNAAGATIYVDIAASGAKNGSSWTAAYGDLQSALSAAQSGDELWVATGNYSTTDGNDRSVSFQLVDGVALYGGFLGHESSLAERDWEAHPTILSGEIGDPDTVSDNSYHVVLCPPASATVLDGFWIRSGAGGSTGLDRDGAGILVDHAELILRHVDVDACRAQSFGGGLANYGGQVRIEHSRFGGEATHGGSIATLENGTLEFLHSTAAGSSSNVGGSFYSRTGSLTLHDSQVTGTAAAAGGAIYASNGSAISLDKVQLSEGRANEGGAILVTDCTLLIQRSTLQQNRALLGWGGALRISGGAVAIANSMLRDNWALSGGGGIFVDTSNVQVTNSVFVANFSPGSSLVGGHSLHISDCSPRLVNVSFLQVTGSEVYPDLVNDGGLPTFSNCILWGPTAMAPRNLNGGAMKFAHSIVLGSGGSGPGWDLSYGIDLGGNLDCDPQYADAAAEDLHLAATSPAIDAGSIAALPQGLTVDRDGNPRVVGASVDMGAYERQAAVATDKMSFSRLKSLLDSPR